MSEFPINGYPNLDLEKVFEQHGIVQGLTELDRRSLFPPARTIDAEIASEIIQRSLVSVVSGSAE